MSPCQNGRCQAAEGEVGFMCVCDPGYSGPRCQVRVSPCDGDPCQSRGTCTAVNHTFHCQCHAWWEGVCC
ncbi:Protocadherin Fat 1 [Portunus trituberculatus]|uniref:Protocadherin Fat 1 n=1 Tax=Portunus trituberculatus TaxID=210409 RepID=A0A5B7KD14_PORTR|nr:Protocadherin Fat 1 [Portunus trituberculatus]